MHQNLGFRRYCRFMNIVVWWKICRLAVICLLLRIFEYFSFLIFIAFKNKSLRYNYEYISLSPFAMSSGIIPTWVIVKKKIIIIIIIIIKNNSSDFSRNCRCLYSKTMVWWWFRQWLTMPLRDSNWSHHKFKISKSEWY
jgi:hypothetical protein